MIYDRPLTLCTLPAGTPIQSRLIPGEVCFYSPREVFHKRFWESVQAGSQIDRMVEIPLHRQVEAGDYALLESGVVYRVEQAQFSADSETGLPITVLSLRRTDGRLQVAAPDEGGAAL